MVTTMKNTAASFLALTGLLCRMAVGLSEQTLANGLVLNLDCRRVEDGMVKSTSLFPLHVPQGELQFGQVEGLSGLLFTPGKGLDIPHSSLLDPHGGEWVVSMRIHAEADGLIMSQADGDLGYAIYLKDGLVHATVRTEHTAVTLAPRNRVKSHDLKKRIVVELRIKERRAILSLNRHHVAMVDLTAPLWGDNAFIRLGRHHALPSVLRNIPGSSPVGFQGVIGSLKIYRQ